MCCEVRGGGVLTLHVLVVLTLTMFHQRSNRDSMETPCSLEEKQQMI